MEVILLQKVANLGTIGDRFKVKSGYGRNFLLPSGKATLATPANIARFELIRADLEREASANLKAATERAAVLRDLRAASDGNPSLHAVGDVVAARTAVQAIYEGRVTGMRL